MLDVVTSLDIHDAKQERAFLEAICTVDSSRCNSITID